MRERRVATGETAKGREAIREALEEMFRVFPDFYIEVRDLFAAKNRICVECTLTGTHEGEWQGISPTGRRIEADICLVFRIGRDGLVEEETIYSDSATMLRQLGLFAESRHRQGVRRMDRAVFERDRLALVSPRHCADRARIGVRCTSLAREHAPNDATERQEAATTQTRPNELLACDARSNRSSIRVAPSARSERVM